MMFSITGRYRDCLSRQVAEALRIHYSKDNILNSKSEYRSNTVSRLSIEEDAWERRERTRLEEEEDKLAKERIEVFRKLKATATPTQSTLPGGSSPDTTLAVPGHRISTIYDMRQMKRSLEGRERIAISS